MGIFGEILPGKSSDDSGNGDTKTPPDVVLDLESGVIRVARPVSPTPPPRSEPETSES